MPKSSAASYHTDPGANSIVLTRPGRYLLSACFQERESLFLVGRSRALECVDVLGHQDQLEELRLKLSAHCSLAACKYPFYVVPWTDVR